VHSRQGNQLPVEQALVRPAYYAQKLDILNRCGSTIRRVPTPDHAEKGRWELPLTALARRMH